MRVDVLTLFPEMFDGPMNTSMMWKARDRGLRIFRGEGAPRKDLPPAEVESILARLDTLCRHQNCDQVIGELLKKFDLVTRLSAWDDCGRAH